MRRPGTILLLLAIIFLVLLAAVVFADSVRAAVQRPFGARPGPDGTVEIVLRDFRFDPAVVRVKAGQRVRLVLRNVGNHTHEFMVGRQVHIEEGVTEPPSPDFFEGISDVMVQVTSGSAMPMGFPGMEGMEMGGMGEEGDMQMGGMGEKGGMEMGGMAGEMGGMALAKPGPHGEGMIMETDEHHGSMVMMDPGSEAVIMFTVPPDKVGMWVFGCFQEEGLHFDSGMRGLLVVEP